MTEPVVLDWADLSIEQCLALLTSQHRKVDPYAELLDFDLNVTQQPVILLGSQGDVHWLGDADIHRDAAFTIGGELSWGTAIVRLSQVLTDKITGLAARRYLGVFCLHTPDQERGSSVRLPDGTLVLPWDVTGQDRLYLLNRQAGRSYFIAGGTPVLTALAAVYDAAGVTGYLIDGSASAATIPAQGMAWPLVVPDSGVKRINGYAIVEGNGSDPTTWLRIVNDLHTLIGYRGVWCDELGQYRSEPYVNPGERAPSFTFNAGATVRGTVGLSRVRSLDMWAAPNRWIFIRSNMPTGTAPTIGNGIYIVDNTDDGPSSQSARNGLVWPVIVSIAAADQDALVVAGDARVAADKRTTATFQVNTVPFPPAEHFGVYTYIEPAPDGGADIEVNVQATEWTVDLWGADTQFTWEAIA